MAAAAARTRHPLVVVVTGYRLFGDYRRFCLAMDNALISTLPNLMLFGDEPTGTDLFAARYASERKLGSIKFCVDVEQMCESNCIVVADWKTGLKGAASPIRNAAMLAYADKHGDKVHMIGFLSPLSTNTKNCLHIATHKHQRFIRTIINIYSN